MKIGSIEVPTEEIGDLWQIEGVVYGNGHDSIVMELPFSGMDKLLDRVRPTEEEWQEFLAQADDPVTPIGKAFVKKATRQIDESVRWKVYQRDWYTCVYCGATGVPMTYDHFLCQKLGGTTTIDNGRTSCRPCNKLKGHLTIDAWKELAAKRGLKSGEWATE